MGGLIQTTHLKKTPPPLVPVAAAKVGGRKVMLAQAKSSFVHYLRYGGFHCSFRQPSCQKVPFSLAVPFDQTVLFFALLDTKLDLLIEHFDRLTEGLTEFRVTMQEGFTSHDIRLDRIVEATERQATVAERQALTIERQSLAIERLALILERQIRGEG